MSFEYVLNSKSQPKLLVDGYAYVKEKCINGTKTYWKCDLINKNKCKARAVSEGDAIQLKGKHVHEADALRIEMLKVQDMIRHRARTTNDRPLEIIKDVCSGVNELIAKRVMSSGAIRRTIRKIRQKTGLKSTDIKETISKNKNINTYGLLNQEGLLKILEDALNRRTADGGVFLSANDVATIETFLGAQDTSLDPAVDLGIVKLEISCEEPLVNYGDSDEVDLQSDDDFSCNDATDEVEILPSKRSYSTVLSSISNPANDIFDKQNTKRSTISHLADINNQKGEINANVSNSLNVEQKNVQNLQGRVEKESGTDNINLLHVLKEIMRTKSIRNEIYYIPPHTAKLIREFLDKQESLVYECSV